MSKTSNMIFAKSLFILSVYFGIYTGYFIVFWLFFASYAFINVLNIVIDGFILSGKLSDIVQKAGINDNILIETLIDFLTVGFICFVFFYNDLGWYWKITVFVLFPLTLTNSVVNFFVVKYLRKRLA